MEMCAPACAKVLGSRSGDKGHSDDTHLRGGLSLGVYIEDGAIHRST
jgi:hypothetical protein